jgi:polyisoprenoid-binding protein YceI
MDKVCRRSLILLAVFAFFAADAVRADEYTLDPAHTAVTFKVSHLGLSWTHGRFNEVSGGFLIEANPAACQFALSIKVDSLDTGNPKRDGHLRSPDFFNSKQFSLITFKSNVVKPIKDGYEVTGDLTLHGVTKSVTFNLLGGRKAEFPKGVQRTGFSAELALKRSEFEMDKMTDAIGDAVHIAISFEGTKK